MTYKDCTVIILEYTYKEEEEEEVILATTNQEGYDSEGNIKFTDDSEIVLWSGILAMKGILEAKVEGFPVGYLLLDGVRTRVVIQETGEAEPCTISLEYPGSRLTWEVSREILEDIWKALSSGASYG